MPQQKVFSGDANTNIVNRTDNLNSAVAFYVLAPDITDELEIDFYLQLEVSTDKNQRIRITPDNFASSLLVYEIPQQYQGLDLNIYGAFLVSFNLSLEVWAITSEVSLKAIKEKIDLLEELIQQSTEQLTTEINDNETASGINQLLNSGIIGTQIGQLQGLTLLATTLAPVTAGTSLTSAAAFELTATSATALLAGGIL